MQEENIRDDATSTAQTEKNFFLIILSFLKLSIHKYTELITERLIIIGVFQLVLMCFLTYLNEHTS